MRIITRKLAFLTSITGEIAATEFNDGDGIDWSDTNFSLYPWWIASVSEAVFLLGAERNADKIIGTTYVRNYGGNIS